MSIRAVIIDDEPLARERLRELCALEPDVSIVAEASLGADAVEQVRAAKPDLLLLDVHARGTDGFTVIERLRPERPLVVFVSAHEHYAREAFDVEAVDYLLKPFGDERFRQAMRRVRGHLAGRRQTELADHLSSAVRESMLSVTGQSRTGARRLVLEREGRLFFVAQSEIDSVEADRNYVTVRSGNADYSMRWTMRQAEDTLDPALFLRVHRSVIVNAQRIHEMERGPHGEYRITLSNGQRFATGRAYRRQIRDHLRSLR